MGAQTTDVLYAERLGIGGSITVQDILDLVGIDGGNYAYFQISVEENASVSSNAYEWSIGNGDEIPNGSGIPIPMDCELFAIATESPDSRFTANIQKSGVTVATSDAMTGSSKITVLGTPVSFTLDDVVGFQTAVATTAGGLGARITAWFRVAVVGQKGDKGDKGDAGADGDMIWRGAWSAGTYSRNDVVQNNGSSYVCIAPVSTTQEPPDTDWDLVAEKGVQGDSGSTQPYAHFIIATTQNMGGANGTVHYVNWDGTPINKDAGFTHSVATNPSRIQVDLPDGRYEIKANVSIQQGGNARTTFMSGLRVNGTTPNVRGRQRNYSRGSSYGDTSTGLNTEIDLNNGDYIEMSITVDDSDGAYTSNTINAECEFIIRKLT